jgi:hypothetical protein
MEHAPSTRRRGTSSSRRCTRRCWSQHHVAAPGRRPALAAAPGADGLHGRWRLWHGAAYGSGHGRAHSKNVEMLLDDKI